MSKKRGRKRLWKAERRLCLCPVCLTLHYRACESGNYYDMTGETASVVCLSCHPRIPVRDWPHFRRDVAGNLHSPDVDVKGIY